MSVLLGAALALLGTIIVQFIVVPEVETRKRRADRWERDLIALGEFLTFDQPKAEAELILAVRFHSVLKDFLPVEDEDPKVQDDARARLKEEQVASVNAARTYEVAYGRAAWLGKRVLAIADNAPKLAPFARARHAFGVAHAELSEFGLAAAAGHPSREIDDAGQRSLAAAHGLVSEIEALLGGRAPLGTPWTRRFRAVSARFGGPKGRKRGARNS